MCNTYMYKYFPHPHFFLSKHNILLDLPNTYILYISIPNYCAFFFFIFPYIRFFYNFDISNCILERLSVERFTNLFLFS